MSSYSRKYENLPVAAPMNVSAIEAQDAELARQLTAEEESSRWVDSPYYAARPQYYYGTWRRPPPRQVVVYRNDEEDLFVIW